MLFIDMYIDTGFKENRQSLLAPMDMHIML